MQVLRHHLHQVAEWFTLSALWMRNFTFHSVCGCWVCVPLILCILMFYALHTHRTANLARLLLYIYFFCHTALALLLLLRLTVHTELNGRANGQEMVPAAYANSHTNNIQTMSECEMKKRPQTINDWLWDAMNGPAFYALTHNFHWMKLNVPHKSHVTNSLSLTICLWLSMQRQICCSSLYVPCVAIRWCSSMHKLHCWLFHSNCDFAISNEWNNIFFLSCRRAGQCWTYDEVVVFTGHT